MATDDKQRFRATVWPPVAPLPAYAVRGASQLPDELVLRELRAVDVSSEPAATAFSEEWGGIESARSDGQQWRVGWVLDSFRLPITGVTHVHIATARALVDHWVASQRNEATANAWTLFDRFGPPDEVFAWRAFVESINGGLRWYHARVVVPIELSPDPRRPLPIIAGEPEPDLYDALCLQLWNLMAEGVPPRECPHCGTTFTRQQGRATAGQYRSTGVTYCSKSCANSANQRRRRQAQRGVTSA